LFKNGMKLTRANRHVNSVGHEQSLAQIYL